MSDTVSNTATGTDSVITTILTTTSISLTTSPTTTVTLTDTSTSTPDVTTPTPTPTPSTVITSETPSTTVVAPTTNPTTPTVVNVTATTTLQPSQPTTVPTTTPSVVVVTSTQPGQTSTTETATVSSDSTSSEASPTPSALSASGSGSASSGGLGSGAKIAIAVIIPIVVIAAAFLIGFFLWRKRKARKNNEELRKNEMAEYGFNPNSDPTLAAGVGAYTDNVSEAQEDNGGYRGWGATSSNRKPSTTLGSNGRAAAGLAMSESSSQPGVTQGSPNTGSDAYSTDPLMNGHPESGDGVGALGVGAGLNRNRSGAAGVRRGPSNASSTYSEGHVSEVSSDNHSAPGPYFQEEVPYNIYNDAAPSHGPYADGSYGGSGGQPVIRDVQARRNTRIERAPTFPQTQGGIAQNF